MPRSRHSQWSRRLEPQRAKSSTRLPTTAQKTLSRKSRLEMNQSQPNSASLPVNEDEEQQSATRTDAPLRPKPPAPDVEDEATAALSDTDEEGAEGEGEQFDEDGDDDEAGNGERGSRRPPRGPVEPAAPPVSFADVVSGEFDQQADATTEASAPKRVLAP